MELYHNQVTREQGSFSLRMFHRSWGLMLIQQNISAPSTLLDFPTLQTFERELTTHHLTSSESPASLPASARCRRRAGGRCGCRRSRRS